MESRLFTRTDRRNLSGNVNGLSHLNLALLKWAFKINVSNLFTKRCFGADQANQTVLHGEKNVRALLNFLLHNTTGLDQKLLTTTAMLAMFYMLPFLVLCLRLRGVGRQVNLVDRNEVLRVIAGAELERRVTRDLVVIITTLH